MGGGTAAGDEANEGASRARCSEAGGDGAKACAVVGAHTSTSRAAAVCIVGRGSTLEAE